MIEESEIGDKVPELGYKLPPAYHCPKHGKQKLVFQTNNNRKFCFECVANFLDNMIGEVEEV